MKEIKLLIGEVKDRLAEIEKLIAEEEPEKIAVKVNTIQEAKVICNHKGWEYTNTAWIGKETCVIYMDGSGIAYNRLVDHESQRFRKYSTVDFDFFCAQKGLNPPKFIMDSVDGVPLYEGDKYCKVHRDSKDSEWYIFATVLISITTNSDCIAFPDNNKAFSTKEAAEKWIEKQNKPKFTDVPLFRKGHHALVYKDQIELNGDGVNFIIKPSDLEEMLRALKSLQCDNQTDSI